MLLGFSFFVADARIDNWTVLRFAGSRALKNIDGYQDPIFGKSVDVLSFRSAVLVRYARIRFRHRDSGDHRLLSGGARLAVAFLAAGDSRGPMDLSFLRLKGGLESRFLRGGAGILLVAIAGRYYLDRFEMVWNQQIPEGIDYTDDHFALPLYWLVIVALIIGAALVRETLDSGRGGGGRQPAAAVDRAFRGEFAVVKPNEISLERPYIESHIEATRAA